MENHPENVLPSSPEAMWKLVNDFVERTQRGESPEIEEYCQQHPDLAEEIRELFPALEVMEDLRPDANNLEDEVESKIDLPEQIGDYRIIGEIGRGGMGVVYEAEQQSLGRRVALKVLPFKTLLIGTSRLRFQQEARAAAKMHHTNIVPVFEVGEDGNYVFYAMQLILGQSLDYVIEELRCTRSSTHATRLGQPPSDQGGYSSTPNDSGSVFLREKFNDSSNTNRRQFYRSVAKIGMQIADALAYAHTRGVIHRDIKPSNLLLDAEGVVWVTDFGLAKVDDEGLTQTGDFLGTLRYMSPERFQGECDVRADIYALGITLYEMLLQQPAFDSSDRLNLIHMINRVQPIKPRQIDPFIPKDLETIILKSIEKEPKARYWNARLLEQDLQRFVNDEPIKAQRTSFLKQTSYWARRNRGLAVAVASIAVLLLVLLVGSTTFAVRQSKLRQTAEFTKNVAEQARIEAEESQAIVERNLYFSQMNFAGKIIGQAAGTHEIKATTDTWLPGQAARDLRGWEWYHLRTYCLESVLPLICPRPNVPLDAVWSPDQTRIATAQQNSSISIWDSSTGELLKTLKGHPNIVVTVAWNAKQDLLAACDDENNIWVWDLGSGLPVIKFKAPQDALVEQVTWDLAGIQLAWSSSRSVFVWDSSQKNKKPIELTGGPGVITSLQWSNDGVCIAGSGWRQRKSVIWDVASQKITKSTFDATLVKWSPKGHEIEGWLLSTPTGEIKFFQAGLETPIRSFLGHTEMARFMSWSSDGKLFVSASGDQTARVWDVETGEQVRAFQGHAAKVLTARFNREGTRVVSASSDRTARIWNVKTPQKRTIQTSVAIGARGTLQDRPETCSLSWHPDGVQLASVGLDGRFRIWDTTTSEVISQDSSRFAETVSWNSDGTWVAMDELEGANPSEYIGEEYISTDSGVAILRETVREPSSFATENRTIFVAHPQRCNGVAWAPNTEKFATVCNDKKVRVWSFNANATSNENLYSPSLLAEFTGHKSRPGGIQWNPRLADVIATCDEMGVIKIWDLNGERWTLTGHDGMIHQLAWSPDGIHLASAGQDGTVRIWDIESGNQINVLTGHHNAVFSVAWNPLGSRIATGSRDSTVKIWEPLAGSEALSLSDHRGAVLSVAWSRDGTQLATADITGAVIVWDASRAYDEDAAKRRPLTTSRL